MVATFQTLKVISPTRTSPPKITASKNHQRLKTNFLEPFGRDILNASETINKTPHGIDILPSDCQIRFPHVSPPGIHLIIRRFQRPWWTNRLILFREFRPCPEVFFRVVTAVTTVMVLLSLILLMVQKSGDHQLRLVVYPIICRVLAPSQVVVSDFWIINSIIHISWIYS